MKKEKHKEALKEVLDEINSAVNDENGLLPHQRRLAFLLSLGAVNLLELHLQELGIIKEGSKINHLGFRRNNEKIAEILQKQLVSPVDSLESIQEAMKIIRDIEEKRDDLAYGAPATEEVLQKKINLFFELKKLIKC